VVNNIRRTGLLIDKKKKNISAECLLRKSEMTQGQDWNIHLGNN
jgi:hypothetical protein